MKKPSKKKAARKKTPQKKKRDGSAIVDSALSLHDDVLALKKDVKKLTTDHKELQERVQDIEIHLNLLTRLLTTLCIEKFGMRVGVLKRIIKRIEKEAIRDSQILHLESLYNRSPQDGGDDEDDDTDEDPPAPGKDDPWEDIS